MNKLKSILLLMLALFVALNSYSNFRMLAGAQQATADGQPSVHPAVFVTTSFENGDYQPVVAHRASQPAMRELMHGLRINFSLAVFLLFSIATSINTTSTRK